MMPVPGHVGAGLIMAYLLGLNPLLVSIGAVLPDMDFIITFFGIKWNDGHRRLTHSLLLPAFILLLSLLLPLLFPVFIGTLVHFATDLDHWGIPLLYPFSNKYYSIVKVRHETNFDKPEQYIKHWLKNRNWKFWLEWLLLVIGVAINWSYLTGLLSYFI